MDQRLIDASQQGEIKALYTLIRESPDILDLIDAKSFVDTPLHLAATAGHTRFALEIMMLKPSFARKLNQDGFSPMHLALQNKKTQTVRRLVHVDPDLVRVKGRGGITPLHFAAEIGDLVVLTEFLSVCPQSIEDLTIRAETALHVAVTHRMFEAFEVLLGWLERGFYQGVGFHQGDGVLKRKVLNWKDDQGNSLLHIATSSNQPQVIRLLIKNRVIINARNLEGLTALDILEQGQFETRDISDMLCDARAKRAANLEKVSTPADYLRSKVLFLEGLIANLMTAKNNMSSENRNGILVIAVLILTTTYQAGLNPPGGFRHVEPNIISNYGNTTTTTTIASDPPPHSLVEPMMGLWPYILFQWANFSAFCASLAMICILVPSLFVIFQLGYSLLGCYLFSVSFLVHPFIGLALYSYGHFLNFLLYKLTRSFVGLSPFNQLLFSVHTEKWSRQPPEYH